MPEISVDKLIGFNLTAAKQLKAYSEPDLKSKVLYTIPSGGKTGKVWSWVERFEGTWLVFKKSYGGYYYILALPKSFKLSEDLKQVYKVEQTKEEQEIVEQKGKIPYYIEKYGKWVLGAFIVVTLAREFIKKKA